MATSITCPNCKTEFSSEDAIAKTLEKEYADRYNNQRAQLNKELALQQQHLENQRKDFEEKRKNENALFAEKLQKEKLKLEAELQEQLRKSISGDYENQIKLLEQANKNNDEKLKLSRQKEFEFLQKEQALKHKEAELDIQVQKKLHEERISISEQIRKQEIEKNALRQTEFQMRLKELEKQLEDQKKLAEEMRRKADQGSMQLQGEVQELAIEDLLKNTFPFDIITEVGKGIRGGDCVQVVRNNFGQECGKIIYESKRTGNFGGDWIDKLKKDMRSTGADIAIMVTKTMPKDMDCFGLKDGVWICSFSEVKAMANVLRDGVIRVFTSAKSHENKGDKINMLYSYLTSNEFSEQWKAIREGFLEMKTSIQKERDVMERLWKAREKQLEKVLLNTTHVKGSIEGIAGQDSIDLNLLEDVEDDDMAH